MIRKTLTERKKEVKDLLSKVGMSFFDNRDTNEFLVWPKGDKKGEDSTYFTLGRTAEDLEDALGSGLDMTRRIKKQNPRCRTFQVKRKVGKKTIQVRRKICNPYKTNEDVLNAYLRGSPYFQFLYNVYGKEIPITQAKRRAAEHGINFDELELKKSSLGHVNTLEFVRELGY